MPALFDLLSVWAPSPPAPELSFNFFSIFIPPPPPPSPPRAPVYLYVFIAAFFLEQLWELFLKLRTRHRLAHEKGVPLVVRAALGEIDDEEYAKSQLYSLAKNNLGFVSDHVIGVATSLMGLWLQPFVWNGPALALTMHLGFAADAELVRMAAMTVICTPVDWLTSWPLSLYRTFVLEERFGFNKHTPRSWFSDTLKEWFVLELLMNLMLTVPLVMLLRNLGSQAWLYAWAFITLFAVAFNVIYPIWIAPLFNTFKPLPAGPAREGIEALVRAAGLRCDRIFEVDGSRQSSHSNAYVAGLFTSKRIVLYDTLSTHLEGDVTSICAVVAHEIGHAVLHHTYLLLLLTAVQIFVPFFTFGFVRNEPNLVTDFGYDTPCTYLYLHCCFAVYSAVTPVLGPITNAVTRRLEFAADAYSVRLGFDIRPALKAISAKNLSNSNPDPLVSLCHHSHPTIVQRVEAVTHLMANKKDPAKRKGE